MIRKFTVIALFFFIPLSASGVSDREAESILTQSARLFDNLSVSVLGFSTNQLGSGYLFSFCLSEDMQWGVVALGSSQGYWLSPENNQIELINCKTTISSKEFMKLHQHISKTDPKETRWTVEYDRPCYNKKIDGEAVKICHTVPYSFDSEESNSFWANPWFYGTTFFVSFFAIEHALLGIYACALIHRPPPVFTCPHCGKES